jgi:quercetin dioxygenase-like cupin family protein
MAETILTHWDELPGSGDDRVQRKALEGDNATVKRIEIKAGATASRHSHPFEQFVLVEKGSGRVQCETGEISIRPGTIIRFPPNAWHSAVFETDTVLLEVNLGAP